MDGDAIGEMVIIWVASLAILFVSGTILGSLTLSLARHPAKSPPLMEKIVRQIYRGVVVLTTLHFYISIPVLVVLLWFLAVNIFSVVDGGSSSHYRSSRSSVKSGLFALIFFAFCIFTIGVLIYSVLSTIFSNDYEKEPGRRLSRADAPDLWAVTDEVARQVGTRAIEVIYLLPNVQVAVMERGGFWQVLFGRGTRCLILGVAALDGMTQDELKAILAHEYGHFNNRDTAGGNFAYQVQVSIQKIGYAMAQSTQFFGSRLLLISPAWWYIYIYQRVFLLSTRGASRLQEILADRYAAIAYGTENLINGLTRVIRQMVVFDYQVNSEIQRAMQDQRGLGNLYTLTQAYPIEEGSNASKNLDREVQKVLNRHASNYDTHPPFKERVHLVMQLNIPAPTETSDALAWDLLPNAEAVQMQMTQKIYDMVKYRMRMANSKPIPAPRR